MTKSFYECLLQLVVVLPLILFFLKKYDQENSKKNES
mgnify:CR=1 FL=1